MDLSSQIVPALIMLLANLLSGRHGSLRWETVTAIFGWAGAGSLLVLLGVRIFAPDSNVEPYLIQLFGFTFLTALSRDYEKILAPLFRWNR